jgi:hypothetical protein
MALWLWRHTQSYRIQSYHILDLHQQQHIAEGLDARICGKTLVKRIRDPGWTPSNAA